MDRACAQVVARPSPLEGVGTALRAAYAIRAKDLPRDLDGLLDRLR